MTLKTTALVLGIAGFSILQSCQKEEELSSSLNSSLNSPTELKAKTLRTFYGPAVPLGGGVARAFVTENKAGEPTSVGVTLSEKALERLPEEPTALVLQLPRNKGKGFYDHALVDWNPHGHEPEHIYDLPHFDFHFYIISREEREAIGPLDPPAYDLAPAAQYTPPFYIQLPGVFPAMGAHWVDVQSPELHGAKFTKTYIWGSTKGEFVFWEPMITLEYLQTKPDVTVALPQPSAYQRSGWYAQQYRVAYSENPGEYSIALENLAYRQAE